MRAALRARRRAVRDGDGRALAAARGALRGALFRGSFAVDARRRSAPATRRTARARGCCCASSARRRGCTRPGADAHARRRRPRARARRRRTGRRGGARRTCSTPTRRASASCWPTPTAALERGLPDAARRGRRAGRRRTGRSSRRATPRTAGRRPPTRSARSSPRSRAPRAAGDAAGFRAARRRSRDGLESFTAAPLTAEESARRAQQLLRFLALVPVEYDRGVERHARSRSTSRSRRPSRSAPAPPPRSPTSQDQLAKRDPARAEDVEAALDELGGDRRRGDRSRPRASPRRRRRGAHATGSRTRSPPRCRRSGRSRTTSPTTT